MATHIQLYDTTLRDGTQREGISLSCADKLKIAQRLDRFGMDFIEGGWPGSNPKDAEFFTRVKQLSLSHAVVTAFGSTCRVDGNPSCDENVQALIDSGAKICTVVGKSSMLHVTDVLRTTPAENLRIIRESVAFLMGHGRRVFYDAEHFFDGFKLNREYAVATLQAAAQGGAETIILCDTNGGTLPWEVTEIVEAVKASIHVPLGIHTHNDGECAVANSLAAVRAGCVHVQGTVNGYGERCGNANLISIIGDLQLKMKYDCLPVDNLKCLSEMSHFVAEVTNLAPDEHAAYTGKSAFAHKGGIHVAAIRRNPDSYQHIDPLLVGNSMRVVVSELSGRGNILSKVEELGIADSPSVVSDTVAHIKQLEAKGFSFEAADASVAMLIQRAKPGYKPPFELIDMTVNVEERRGRGIFSEATVKILINDEVVHTAAEGVGPVNALDAALRKALTPVYPVLDSFCLADYKVRIIDGERGTAATTRVLLDTQNGTRRWTTVGASANIIEASWQAIYDSVEYGLTTGAKK